MCSVLPRACGELSVGEELTRSRSALMLSGSCSTSRGVSGNSVRLDGWINGEENEKKEKWRVKMWTYTQMIIYHLKPLTAFKKTTGAVLI